MKVWSAEQLSPLVLTLNLQFLETICWANLCVWILLLLSPLSSVSSELHLLARRQKIFHNFLTLRFRQFFGETFPMRVVGTRQIQDQSFQQFVFLAMAEQWSQEIFYPTHFQAIQNHYICAAQWILRHRSLVCRFWQSLCTYSRSDHLKRYNCGGNVPDVRAKAVALFWRICNNNFHFWVLAGFFVFGRWNVVQVFPIGYIIGVVFVWIVDKNSWLFYIYILLAVE